MLLPPPRKRYEIGRRWARVNGLDLEITDAAGVNHDWLHAVLELGTTDEGLVFAADECLRAGLLIDADFFGDLALDMSVPDDDWPPHRANEVHARLAALAFS
jgi:hypothetical protein